MKSGRQIIILAAFIFVTVSITVSGQSFSLLSTAPTNSSAQTYNTTNVVWGVTDTNALIKYLPPRYWTGQSHEKNDSNSVPFEIYRTNLIPLIQFEDVPVTIALENLARQAGLNYLLDPQIGYNELDQFGQIRPEPTVTLRWENITATYALMVICTNYSLTIVTDPQTSVVLLRNKNHDVNQVPPSFWGNDTNLIPLIEFQSVPLSRALKNLARQAQMRCIFSARVDTGHWENEPAVSFRWESLTASQAFAALCENYDLDVIKYPISGIIRVEPAD